MTAELIRTFTSYHLATIGRIWDSIQHLTEEQFHADDEYSRGSIRNLMVHLANTDSNWLAGLKNIPESEGRPRKAYQEYTDRASARVYWEQTANELREYVEALTDEELNEHPRELPFPRWQVLLHVINHGTDHCSTVLQKLHRLGAPTFEPDLIYWLSNRK
jgi:uncharacterized damage-inducible protein DinB